MDTVLQGLSGVKCIIDDMIITGRSDKEHLQNLENVLQRLEKYNLRIKLEKCEFFKDRISFCGHEIDMEGLHKTQSKIEAVVKAPKPENVSELRTFLGLVNYYNRFLKDVSTVLHPLYERLRRDKPWVWSDQCEEAFCAVKALITSPEVLTHYNPNLPIRLACDASPVGLGAVLSHVMDDGVERPIAYASRSLTKAERNYSQIDKEALALIWEVKRFHTYLFGREFTLLTDHQPLVSIFHPRKGIPMTTAARLQRYALFLAGHNYRIEYKNTKMHGNADCLSRLPVDSGDKETVDENIDPVEVLHIAQFDTLPVSHANIQRATRNDPVLSKVHEMVMTGCPEKSPDVDFDPFFHRRNELTVHQGCLLWGMRVIIPHSSRKKILEELHEGHIGVVKMKALARSHVWWPGIDKDIDILAKRTMFLIMVDAYSKWPEVVQMNKTTSGRTLLRTIFARNGLPIQLVSDNGPQFTSEEFATFMKANGVEHVTSAPYHPSTNGLVERFVQSFKMAMRSSKQDVGSVQKKLSKFLLAYRNASQATTGEPPAKLFMGRTLMSRLELIRPDLRQHVRNKQLSMQENRAAHHRIFETGQSVIMRDYRGQNKWVPGIIRTRTGPVSYRVEVAPGIQWRRHVDQIRDSRISQKPAVWIPS
ncbi:uncharacterized protein K02A2.6-like [Gigantopelta aegis]|uniref:uncharacterized protein K02A2.6-like n=1 Tax=Gigantopelta aegis TaxID=1735272 RepID=UPI001B889284|nr:uncharacterized protein K02A2.6-like [Gigantopelta aegis]